MNMDGTALYEAAAALFVANLMGIELSLAQQAVVFFTAMIASTGAPGIPSAGMVTMVMVLQAVGLPAEAVAILLHRPPAGYRAHGGQRRGRHHWQCGGAAFRRPRIAGS